MERLPATSSSAVMWKEIQTRNAYFVFAKGECSCGNTEIGGMGRKFNPAKNLGTFCSSYQV